MMVGTVAVVELQVTATARDGAGVARADDGRVVFVEGALAGERVVAELVQADRRWSRARTVQVIDASPERVPVNCVHQLEGCGGCDLLHVGPDGQRAMKLSMAIEQLTRVGIEPPTPTLRALHNDAGRTTARAGVVNGRAGFRERGSHALVQVDSCEVLDPILEELLVDGRFPHSERVLARVGNRTGERIVVVDAGAADVSVPADVRVISEPELAAGTRAWIHEEVAGFRFRVSANSFFQNRPAGAEALVGEVGAMIGDAPEGLLVDAYSGVGLFSATLAHDRPVVAIERGTDSVADAKINLREVNAKVVRADVARWRPSPAAVVIADPAREGLGARAVQTLMRSEPSVLVLVSCDLSSFARDTRLLQERGLRLDRWTVIDLFPGTSHVETVARFVV
jgi:23S rRNA (uracil1939-C5)-methyltransferase